MIFRHQIWGNPIARRIHLVAITAESFYMLAGAYPVYIWPIGPHSRLNSAIPCFQVFGIFVSCPDCALMTNKSSMRLTIHHVERLSVGFMVVSLSENEGVYHGASFCGWPCADTAVTLRSVTGRIPVFKIGSWCWFYIRTDHIPLNDNNGIFIAYPLVN
jgi:hypothetical protein